MDEDRANLSAMRHSIKTAILPLILAVTIGVLPSPSLAFATSQQSLWLPPLGSPLRVSAHYDLANGPYQAGHRGIDLRSRGSKQALSPTSGIVSFVGTVVDRPLISIRVDEQTTVSFEPLTSNLRVGDSVARGDPIGTITAGGHCASECLHLGVRVDGNYVNPMRYFVARAVLVPW